MNPKMNRQLHAKGSGKESSNKPSNKCMENDQYYGYKLKTVQSCSQFSKQQSHSENAMKKPLILKKNLPTMFACLE